MILDSIEAVLSLVIGLIFLAAAIPKLRRPKAFVLAVLEYRVLSPPLSRIYARLLPPLELLTGLLLLSGTAVRLSAAVVSILLISFVAGVGINVARGRDLDCQCFGRTKQRRIGWGLLLQDVALLGASIVLGILGGVRLGVASWSVFHLLGPLGHGSLFPVLSCFALALVVSALLGRPRRGSRYGIAVNSAAAKR